MNWTWNPFANRAESDEFKINYNNVSIRHEVATASDDELRDVVKYTSGRTILGHAARTELAYRAASRQMRRSQELFNMYVNEVYAGPFNGVAPKKRLIDTRNK